MSYIKGTYIEKLINNAIDGCARMWGPGDGHRPPHLHLDTMMEWQQDLDEDGIPIPPPKKEHITPKKKRKNTKKVKKND